MELPGNCTESSDCTDVLCVHVHVCMCVLIQEADDTTVKSSERTLAAAGGGVATKLSSLVNGVDSPRYDRRYCCGTASPWPAFVSAFLRCYCQC